MVVRSVIILVAYVNYGKNFKYIVPYNRVHVVVLAVLHVSSLKKEKKNKIHQIIMGSDDSRFGSLCTTLIGIDPLPTLGEAYSQVVREEQRVTAARNREQHHDVVGFTSRGDQKNLTSHQATEVAAYLGRTDISTNRSDNSILKNKDRSPTCSHCGRVGHEKK
ncbi:hypothetical protein V5N11_004148 [Cardamine amara subsp. amara]|uniref:CCHC-type domain-containing protein n=1 Tax=Cardamine amara subsp. amara TaxID=228776 RepID=A0ABD0ZES3_CARAN